MKIKTLFDTRGKRDISGPFHVCTDAGCVDGTQAFSIDNGCVTVVRDRFTVTAVFQKVGDVYCRRDTITNTSDQPLYLTKYDCRFTFAADDVEVYTQQSNWANESNGRWNRLVSEIASSNYGVRATAGAAPFMALWDNACRRGTAFHLLPNAAWQMRVARRPANMANNVTVVEMGISDDRLCLCIQPEETIQLPEILFFEFDDRTDMGCRKLHEYWNTAYPTVRLPIIYNTWFANFDGLSLDFCLKQAERAAEAGAEYFVVDAGWFGFGTCWGDLIGDWRENTTGSFCGRMNELADAVRKAGMKFGLWIEAERALKDAPIMSEHPEYFLHESGNYFLNFADEAARTYIEQVVYRLIDTYGIDYIKFDFNADCGYDDAHAAFYRYHQGHRTFIENVRRYRPGIYLENCASGGNRMDLYHATYMDGIWFSDNQNPYFGTRILRDTVLRMPPQQLERWATVQSVDGFTSIYSEGGRTTRTVSVFEGTWQSVCGVSMAYYKAFCTGGAFGITCNLTALNEADFRSLCEAVTAYKQMRDFYCTASCTPLVATDALTVLQYCDADETTVVLQLFENNVRQETVTVYPKLQKARDYIGHTAVDLRENGVVIPTHHGSGCSDFCDVVTLKTEEQK